jgi:hypothetical protein
MRLGGIVLMSLLLTAACSQPASTTTAAPDAAAAVDTIAGKSDAAWAVQGGKFENGKFSLEAAGNITLNDHKPVSANTSYTANLALTADAPAAVKLRIASGCGTQDLDQTVVSYNVTAGANTLRANHVFTRAASCARVSLLADAPISFTLGGAHLLKN